MFRHRVLVAQDDELHSGSRHRHVHAAVVLIGIGWWFIRSYIVLDGDPLGLDTREKMAMIGRAHV